ncbi:MAG: hypothetical protein K2W82_06500 [Candidatus Obscuribacterales bacterium]|nr:hypothetical protein [Candidatus Obscuribacterales bacterium]
MGKFNNLSVMTGVCLFYFCGTAFAGNIVKKTAKPQAGLKATIMPALGSKPDPYDPNATSWPISRPATTSSSAAKGNFIYKSGSNRPLVLMGGVEENVPKTPEDVSKYLRRMKEIINQYDRLVASTLLNGSTLNVNPESIEIARQQTQQLISQIRSTIPPVDLKESHGKLADTMGNVSRLLDGGSGGGLGTLAQSMAVAQEVPSTMNTYHQAVMQCIAFYGLSPTLDPFSDEDPAMKARFAEQTERFKQQRINELSSGSNAQAGNSAGGLGGLGGLLGGDLGSLGSLLGGNGGSAGDLGQLMKMLPGMLGGGQGQNKSAGGSLFDSESPGE